MKKISKSMREWLTATKMEVEHYTHECKLNLVYRLSYANVLKGVRRATNGLTYRRIVIDQWENHCDITVDVDGDHTIHIWQDGHVGVYCHSTGEHKRFSAYMLPCEAKVGKFYEACREANKYMKSVLA